MLESYTGYSLSAVVDGLFLAVRRDAVGVFYSPSRLVYSISVPVNPTIIATRFFLNNLFFPKIRADFQFLALIIIIIIIIIRIYY